MRLRASRWYFLWPRRDFHGVFIWFHFRHASENGSFVLPSLAAQILLRKSHSCSPRHVSPQNLAEKTPVFLWIFKQLHKGLWGQRGSVSGRGPHLRVAADSCLQPQGGGYIAYLSGTRAPSFGQFSLPAVIIASRWELPHVLRSPTPPPATVIEPVMVT